MVTKTTAAKKASDADTAGEKATIEEAVKEAVQPVETEPAVIKPALEAPARECECKCECEFPYFARYQQNWRAMEVVRIVTVLGKADNGMLICFHENMGVKTISPEVLERV